MTFSPPKSQLLKWVGNKQKFAAGITQYFPGAYGRYFEPFLGSGAILAALAPRYALASDSFRPLMEIWLQLKKNPETLIRWYAQRRQRLEQEPKPKVYGEILHSYNTRPNGADFLFLTRSCYGGIVRFRKADGYMSTPCGVHEPISTASFTKRVQEWHQRLKNIDFAHCDYQLAFAEARAGDLIYCDPPYSHSQSILYGAQDFRLEELLQHIDRAKAKGIKVALSIDGHKRSGNFLCELPIPKRLFRREVYIPLGRSMLRRFQLEGKTLESEQVADRLLLTW